jgi:hypothetical protein
MKKHLIYCSACDREVIVVLRDEASASNKDIMLDVVCTEIGKHCTGELCPVCAKPPDTIRDQLEQLGLQ